MALRTATSVNIDSSPNPFIRTSLTAEMNHFAGMTCAIARRSQVIFSIGNIKPESKTAGNISPMTDPNNAAICVSTIVEMNNPSDRETKMNNSDNPDNSQKLPTTVSVALAMTLRDHNIDCDDINSHSTLTSLYGILAMARIHNQNPRTYAEIMATVGDSRKIVRSFAENILKLIDLAEQGEIAELANIMETNKSTMPQSFLLARMKQAKAVDEVMSQPSMKISES